MSELNEQIIEQNGYYLHIIPTKKFKTNVLLIRFLAPLEKETATKRALLPFVLQKGTKNFPSERQLRTKLDELYGAKLNMDCSKKGENHLITIQISFVNEKFLPTDEQIMADVLSLVKELLLEPNGENGSFKKEIVEREKDTLRQKIQSIKDQKMSYANMRLIDEMCKGEPFETHVHGYLEDLDEINEKNLYETFQAMLNDDRMDIYVLGDIDANQVETSIQKHVNFRRNRKHEATNVKANKEVKDYNEVIEAEKVQQGKLHIGFRTNTTFSDDDYYVLQVFNGLFGGFPHSKLFMNVREKHQLAYYASSRIESHKGLLLVFSGIAPSAFQKAKEIIMEQWNEMKQGNFTDEQVEETKRLTIHQLKETFDHPVGIIELMYHQVIGNKSITPNEMFEAIEQVKKEDLIQLAEKMELDTIFFLTSEGEEQ